MLSAADSEFVSRDPALPGLALLLNPDAFAARLRASLSLDVGAARATYVRYKPQTNCLVAYRLQIAGAEIDVYAKAHTAGTQAKLGKARQRRNGAGTAEPGVVTLDDMAVVVYVFPNDPKLKVLARLAGEDTRRLLRKLLPNRPEFWDVAMAGLHYKPERRYVAQLTTTMGQCAVLKIYTRGNYGAAKRSAKVFASRGPLRLAQRLGRSNRHGILALEWLPGRPLDQAARDPKFDLGTAGAVGAALAELHAQNPPHLASLSREAEAVSLLTAAEGVAAVCPSMAERAYNLARRLAGDLFDAPALNCPSHGDFSADQVLLTGEGVAILDLDEAVRGDPAADLGSFAAQLERDILMSNIPADRARALTDELLSGYRLATRRDLPARIGLYTAAGLLRLVPESFRNREPDWPERTAAILARAEAILWD